MSKTSIILGLSLTLLQAACGAPDAPVASESFAPDAEPLEQMTRLAVRINASEPVDGRLVVALFEGSDPWGWTLDVQEQDQVSATQVLSFSAIEAGLITARVVLDREPFDWIQPGPEDLVVSQSVGIEVGMNSIEFNLEPSAGAVNPVDPVDPVDPDDNAEGGLPVRVGCSCDELSHAEIAILSNDGEVLQSETLTNPELPTNLTMDGLEAGLYKIAWRTNDYPDWVGERSFRIPLRNAPLMVLIGPNRPATPPGGESEPDPEPNPEPVEEPEPAPEPEAEEDELPGDDQVGEPEPEGNLQELRETDDFPNQSDRAQPISPNARIEARLSGVRDFDWFVFELDQDSTVTIETQGETDTRCEVTRDQDNATAQDDDSGEGTNCRMIFEGLAPGTYRLRISHYSWVGQGDYTLVLQQGIENP